MQGRRRSSSAGRRAPQFRFHRHARPLCLRLPTKSRARRLARRARRHPPPTTWISSRAGSGRVRRTATRSPERGRSCTQGPRAVGPSHSSLSGHARPGGGFLPPATRAKRSCACWACDHGRGGRRQGGRARPCAANWARSPCEDPHSWPRPSSHRRGAPPPHLAPPPPLPPPPRPAPPPRHKLRLCPKQCQVGRRADRGRAGVVGATMKKKERARTCCFARFVGACAALRRGCVRGRPLFADAAVFSPSPSLGHPLPELHATRPT